MIQPSQVSAQPSKWGQGGIQNIVGGNWHGGPWSPTQLREWWAPGIGQPGSLVLRSGVAPLLRRVAEVWCSLDLGRPTLVGAVRVQNAQFDGFCHIKDIAVAFSDGSRDQFTLPKDGAVHTLSFRPRETSFIRIELLGNHGDGVAGPGYDANTGGFSEVEVLELVTEPQPRKTLPACTLGQDGGKPPAQVGAPAPGWSREVRAGACHLPAGLPARIGAWMTLPAGDLPGEAIEELPGIGEWCQTDDGWAEWKLEWDSGEGLSVTQPSLCCALVDNPHDYPLMARAEGARGVWLHGRPVEATFRFPPGRYLIALLADGPGAACFVEEDGEQVTQGLSGCRGAACLLPLLTGGGKLRPYKYMAGLQPSRVIAPGEFPVFALPESQNPAHAPPGARLLAWADIHIRGNDGRLGPEIAGRAVLDHGQFAFSDLEMTQEGHYTGTIFVPALGVAADAEFYCRRAVPQGPSDLDSDGRPDLLRTRWNGKDTLIISNDGRFPFEGQKDADWSDFLNGAFNAGEEPPVVWNPMRGTWGDFELLVDNDGDGVFDGQRDFYYHALDVNHDGAPEGEFYLARIGAPWVEGVAKTCLNLDGSRPRSLLDFKNAAYAPNEQRYRGHSEYYMNVQGSGFFLNCRYVDPLFPLHGWEQPIAWYDFSGNGHNDMVIRCADTSPGFVRGNYSEFEIGYELNRNNTHERYHTLDMQITYTAYRNGGLPYGDNIEEMNFLRGRPDADFIFLERPELHTEARRAYAPYADLYRLGTEFPGWEGVWLLFDEDDEDVRWEEMFSPHETGWTPLADHLGDRYEVDPTFAGGGQLYVGKFDGRLHLYEAKDCHWTIDYYGLFHGSEDRAATAEGPAPPSGLRIAQVRYYDENENGFIDRIVYSTAEYGREATTERTEREVNLLDFATPEDPEPDRCPLFSPAVNTPLTGITLADWNGEPLDLSKSPAKAGSDKLRHVYEKLSNDLWEQGNLLYHTARELGLTQSEEGAECSAEATSAFSRGQLAKLTDYRPLSGYASLIHAHNLRERYFKGYWLREGVFADVVRALPQSGRREAERLYYTGRIGELCDYLRRQGGGTGGPPVRIDSTGRRPVPPVKLGVDP